MKSIIAILLAAWCFTVQATVTLEQLVVDDANPYVGNNQAEISLGAQASVGNLVAIWSFGVSEANLSCADDGANTYTEIVCFETGGSFSKGWIHYSVITSGATDITCTADDSMNKFGEAFSAIAVAEFGGIADPPAGATSGPDLSDSTTVHTASDITTTTPDSVILGISAGSNGTWTGDARYTDVWSFNRGVSGYQILSNLSTEGWTVTSTTNRAACNLIVEMQGSGAAGPSVGLLRRGRGR